MGVRKNWPQNLILHRRNFFNQLIIQYFLLFSFFVFLFTLYRFFFLVANFSDFHNIPFFTILQAFLVGLRFDVSVVLYFLSVFFVLNSLFYFINKNHLLFYFNLFYLTLVSFILFFAMFVEIEFYRYFHTRLNIYVMNIEKSPGFVLKMVWESYPVVLYLFLIVLFTTTAFFILKKILKMQFDHRSPAFGFKFVSFVVFGILTFIGIRGTLSSKTPLRWGHAFFSTYNQCNKLALNGIFTLVDDILKNPGGIEDVEKLFPFGSKANTKELEALLNDSTSQFVKFPLRKYTFAETPKKYNVVVFLLESFSMGKIKEYTNKGYSLFINKLKNEGIFFENIYSNGTHTYMGLFSATTGLPNLLGKSLLVRAVGQQNFNGLTQVLKKIGYQGYFAVSHDPNFDNMAGFLRGNGVDDIVSQFDFPSSYVISSLGIADHILFERMNQVFANSKTPFYAIILSTNNHGPWIIPKVEGKIFHSTFDYTDWALGHFFELAKREKYFDSTIFVITADHGLVENPLYDLPLEGTHVPLLIYAPQIVRPFVSKVVGSHLDIQNTILSLLKVSFDCTNMGRNLLAFDPKEENGFAVFHEGQTLGIVFGQWFLVDRLKSNCSLYKYKSSTPRFDYSEVYPDTVDFLRRILEGFYYRFNRIILERKISPELYYDANASRDSKANKQQ
jgi:phosphoglycerol transferase MdoB-like AlkP superfamily enzyme